MTKPLSKFVLDALESIASGDHPAQEFNAGVNRKLVDEGYATYVMKPSPYKRSLGTMISHLRITEKGAAFLLARSTP